MILGNKSDMEERREVSTERGEAVSKIFKIYYNVKMLIRAPSQVNNQTVKYNFTKETLDCKCTQFANSPDQMMFTLA